ncbi:type II toxin-antitoxin system Phd/YefM family antitoxin [Schumannella luteola]
MSALVNVYDAKTQFSQLISRVEAGEEITIARNGRPVARLVPLTPRRDRTPGLFAAQITLHDDFDAFDAEHDAAWYGR